jgi:hypothetical protein
MKLGDPGAGGNFRLRYARVSICEVSLWGLGVIQDSERCSLDSDCESLWMKMIGKPDSGKLNVRLCVQRRLACSAGVSPAGVRARSPVA